MGGFKVVEGVVDTVWKPLSYTGGSAVTVYNGSLVTAGGTTLLDGVAAIPAATAGPNTAAVPYGVVIGTDVYPGNDTFSTTYNAESLASLQSQANQVARKQAFAEGMFAKGDPQCKVKVALIGSMSVIEGPIRNAAVGTGPTLLTVTTGTTTGDTFVHNTNDFTPVANNSTYYCRSGANAGLYRVNYATSTTTPTFRVYWPYDVAIGDTFVAVPVGLGRCSVDFSATGLWIDQTAALSNYYLIDVISMDLSVSGQEKVKFRFVL